MQFILHLTSILEKDDEVIVFEPAYDSYIPNIIINGAKPVLIQLQYPDYSIPWDEVKNKIQLKQKLLLLIRRITQPGCFK